MFTSISSNCPETERSLSSLKNWSDVVKTVQLQGIAATSFLGGIFAWKRHTQNTVFLISEMSVSVYALPYELQYYTTLS